MDGHRSKIPLDAALEAFDAVEPGAPLTASEVAEELGCARRTAYGKLEALVERGDLRSKKVGARGRVWWRPGPDPAAGGRDASTLSRAQFDEFVDEVEDYAIFVLDADGRVRSWNQGARRIKGYEEDEITGEHFSTFYTESDRANDVPQRNLRAAAAMGRVEDEGLRVREDGSTFWANVVITALHDEGDLQGFVKVTRDMTERHEYEERLRKEKERFEALVDEVEDYAIFMLDPDGRVRSWNQGARRIKGYEEDEITGEHFSTFYPEGDREEGVPQRNLRAAAAMGRVEDEGLRVREDGSTFWANVVITALHDDDGEIRGYAKITRDMTERHEYEERLRAQRDELDELNRINGVIRDVDQALVTATTREEIGQAVCERLAGSDTYAAAWVGEYADDHGDVTPLAWAGLSDAYVAAIGDAETDAGAPIEQDVGATALRTRRTRAIEDFRGDGDGEAWRADAVTGGFESAVVIPLVYEDVEYGVLTVYADREDAFDERKLAVLDEMGETISHAITAIRRKERERTLTALQESTRELIQAESPEAIGDVVVDALTEDLALEDALVYLFDTSENSLEPVSASFPVRSLEGGPEPLAAGDDSPVWRSYVDAEPRSIEPGGTSILPASGLEAREALAIPLGDHGVLVVAAARGEAIDEETRNLVGLVGATAEAGFDRVETQANLRERDQILQERNQRLQRLNQLNGLIRDVDQALIGATTREEVERVVCEQLTDSDRFRFAWIGRRDDVAGELVPQAWSGSDQGYLDSVTPLADAQRSEPAVRAAETGTVTVVSNVAEDLRSARWRREAFTREFQSVIAVPLEHDGIGHGVLTVYADRPGVFGELEQDVFGELGETIASTLNAVETRQSLLSDAWVELEFQLDEESTSFLSRLAADVGSEVVVEGSVPLSSDRTRLFFSVDGVDAGDVEAAIAESVAVESSRRIASHDDGHLFEAVVCGETIPVTLQRHGASLESLTVTAEGITVVVSLPADADVRGFIQRFRAEYESAEFIARRRRERVTTTRQGLRALVDERLTERQREVLQTAYFGGFFDSPRRSTGSDIAEMLDVSQPTVTEHLRTAQAKLLDLVLDEQAPRT